MKTFKIMKYKNKLTVFETNHPVSCRYRTDAIRTLEYRTFKVLFKRQSKCLYLLYFNPKIMQKKNVLVIYGSSLHFYN